MKERCKPYLRNEVISELLERLSRIEGQIRGIRKMIEEKRDCNEILVQVSAVRSALSGVAIRLLEEHGESCIIPLMNRNSEEVFRDFFEAVKVFLRRS